MIGVILVVISWTVIFFLCYCAVKSNTTLWCAKVFCFLYRHKDWNDYVAIKHRTKPLMIRSNKWAEMICRPQWIQPRKVYFIEDASYEKYHAFWIGRRMTNIRFDNETTIMLYWDLIEKYQLENNEN